MAVWGKSREIHQVPTIVGQDPAEYGDISIGACPTDKTDIRQWKFGHKTVD